MVVVVVVGFDSIDSVDQSYSAKQPGESGNNDHDQACKYWDCRGSARNIVHLPISGSSTK
eukprot:2368167-Heterocapsa_arctica.AAC.1